MSLNISVYSPQAQSSGSTTRVVSLAPIGGERSGRDSLVGRGVGGTHWWGEEWDGLIDRERSGRVVLLCNLYLINRRCNCLYAYLCTISQID